MTRRQNEYASFSLDEKQAQEFAGSEDVENEVERRQDKRLLKEAMAQLDKRERDILCGYFFKGLSLRRLAEKYDVSHTKIGNEINDTLSKLRQYITDKKE